MTVISVNDAAPCGHGAIFLTVHLDGVEQPDVVEVNVQGREVVLQPARWNDEHTDVYRVQVRGHILVRCTVCGWQEQTP